MIEDEELFLKLNMMFEHNSQDKKELIKYGYITQDEQYTPKACEFKKRFIDKLKEPLFMAMKKADNDKAEAMKIVGIKYYPTFETISEKLIEEGKFFKDKYGEYKVK